MWRNVLILSALILLPLSGYTIYWWNIATDLEIIAEKNLEDTAEKFSKTGVSFTYEDMTIVGYPSMPLVRLTEPRLEQASYGGSLSLSADELYIEPDDAKNTTFRILIPQAVHAEKNSGAGTGEYDISADFVPKLTVRTAGGYREESKAKGPMVEAFKSRAAPPPKGFPMDMLYEYALNMPKNMKLTVEAEAGEVDIGFQWPLVPYRIWQPLHYQIASQMELFFAFLEEAEEKM